MAIKKVEDVQLSLDEKRSCIEKSSPDLSIKKQCELIELNRSSYYYQAKEPKEDKDLALMNLIDEIYTKHPFFGSRQMRNRLRDLNDDYPELPLSRINRKKVQRLMRKMGLVSVAPKPNTSKPGIGKHHKIYPYLLRGMEINKPRQVFCSDVTYSVPGVQGEQKCSNEPRVYLEFIKEVA